MPRVEITEAADRDLTEIYLYSHREFGEQQADRYLAGLDDCLQALAKRPLSARSADRLRPGYRRFEYGSHIIFFVTIEDGIRVVRVLHQRMDVKRHL